jgi:adenine-specific DNA-methyltransferase
MDKLKMQSADGVQDNIQKIAALFPNCVTETVVGYHDDGSAIIKQKVDFEKLQQELSDAVISGREERYQFTWPDKRKAILAANAPVNATLRPCREESVDFDTTQNLYIEGDNLDVLKCLKETYLHKVKMIYIDPPYNTGNDFVYEDDFAESASDYLANSGQFDEQGNRMVTIAESSGRFHTDWLNMIYPRLKVARDLLSEDGVIFISIDDREADNLIKVCDELFGESCFVCNISWQKNYSPRNDSKGIPAEKECIVVYGKSPNWTPKKLPRTEEMDAKYKNPDNDVMPWTSSDCFAPGAKTHQGMVYAIQHPITGEFVYPTTNRCWSFDQKEVLHILSGWCEYELKDINDEAKRAQVCGIDEGEVRKGVKAIVLKNSLKESKEQAEAVLKRGQWPKFYFTKNGMGGIRRKTYLEKVEGKMVTNFWPYTEVGHTDEAKKELKALFDGEIPFETPKPVRLIQRIVQISTNEGDIIVDFFSGAASTAQAVMQHNTVADDGGNRKFIMVQIPEKVDNKWGNLCEIGKERIRRAGKKIKADSPLMTQDLDTGFRVLKLDSTNMQDIYYSPKDTEQRNLFNMVDNVKPDRTSEDLLFQVMLELGATLDSKIEVIRNEDLGMRNDGKGYTIYNVADGYLVACFDQDVTDDVVTAIAKMQPMYAVLRDTSMATDSTATNFEQIFKTYSPNTVTKIL